MSEMPKSLLMYWTHKDILQGNRTEKRYQKRKRLRALKMV